MCINYKHCLHVTDLPLKVDQSSLRLNLCVQKDVCGTESRKEETYMR